MSMIKHTLSRAVVVVGVTAAVVGSAGVAQAGGPTRQPVHRADADLQREVAEGERYCGPGMTVRVFDHTSPTKQRTTCLDQVRVPHRVEAGKAPWWKPWKWRF